ncbi:MAG: MFS transporter [Candidatus Methanomethylophilaceae archaeon]|nr:MFS transporter [Candidatus Methanomethylophilaceae archaeon]
MSETVLDRRHTALMLVAMFVATLMDGLDSSIVSVALPNIGDDLGIDTGTAAWVTMIYMMVLAGLIIPFARVCSNYGVKLILTLGFALFTVSSLFCGLFNSFPILIAARAVQGVGAAMLAAAGPICCTEHLPRNRLAFGLGVLTIGASLGYAIGPAVGGIVVELLSWHWIFLINIPIGLIVIPIAFLSIPSDSEVREKKDLDLVGTATFFIAMSSAIFAIETVAYPDLVTLSCIAAVLFVIFTLVFIAWERHHPEPMLKLSMFRDLGFCSVFLCLMFVNIAYMILIYLVPFYGEISLGLSPMEIGLLLFIPSVITAVTGLPVSKLSDRYGRRPFCIIAGAITMFSVLLYVFLADSLDIVTLAFVLVPQGLGWAFVGGPMASRLVEHAGAERDMAASMTNEAYYIGGALGLAVGAMVFTAFSHSDGVDIMDVTASAFNDGFVAACIVAAVFAAAIVVMSYLLRDDRQE